MLEVEDSEEEVEDVSPELLPLDLLRLVPLFLPRSLDPLDDRDQSKSLLLDRLKVV